MRQHIFISSLMYEGYNELIGINIRNIEFRKMLRKVLKKRKLRKLLLIMTRSKSSKNI